MVFTRHGDGSIIDADAAQIKEELIAGTTDAAGRGKIDPLGDDDLDRLLEICTRPGGISPR